MPPLACADPGIFARGRGSENSSDSFFCSFSPQLILQFYRGCPMVISKKFSGQTFSGGGGGQLFPGGVQMLISIYIHKKTGPTECSFGYISILAIIRVICLSCCWRPFRERSRSLV